MQAALSSAIACRAPPPWKIASRLGWDDTRPAEYLAVAQLQSDLLVTDDERLRQFRGGLDPARTVRRAQLALTQLLNGKHDIRKPPAAPAGLCPHGVLPGAVIAHKGDVHRRAGR
jgi:hypothetical protein